MVAPATTADLIVELLQRYYRNPMRYRAQVPREAQALGHLDVVLRLALGRPVLLSDPTLCGPAAAADLARAAVFYIQQSFFREGATHYEILGLAPDAAAGSVRENFRLLMQLIHPDRHGADTPWPESFAARATRAYAVLKGPQTRADYDRQQAAVRAKESATRTAVALARTHVPVRVVARRRQPLRVSALPEWLTAGVGGLVRLYPGSSVFAGLIVMSALLVGTAIWPERESVLTADSRYAAPERPTPGTPDRARIAEVPPVNVVTATESSPPRLAEAEAVIAAFVASYENGRLPMFVDLFDADVQTDQQGGRAAIGSEYDQLFRSTAWRRMRISQLRWQPVGDRMEGNGELTMTTGWWDGREAEQRVTVEMELVRHGGRVMIAKLSLQPR